MARVFTTDFELHGQQYKAIVTIHHNTAQLKIAVRFLDEDIKKIIGGDSIEFVGLTGYKKLLHLHNSVALQVLDTITNAILIHLLR